MVMQRYPAADQSMPARYARAIAMFRRGDIQNALPIIDGLTKELPENPYFWELKAQALLENGRAAQAAFKTGTPEWTRASDVPRCCGRCSSCRSGRRRRGLVARRPSRGRRSNTPSF